MQWFMVAVMYAAAGVLVYFASQNDEKEDETCGHCHGGAFIEVESESALASLEDGFTITFS